MKFNLFRSTKSQARRRTRSNDSVINLANQVVHPRGGKLPEPKRGGRIKLPQSIKVNRAVLGSVVFISLIAVIVYISNRSSIWIENSSWSTLKHIQVIGLNRLTESEILSVAQIPLESNIMRIQLDSIAMRVSSLPAVRTARVIKRIPHRVQVIVEERKPIAMAIGEKVTLIDEDGATFPMLKHGEPLDLPAITGDIKANNRETQSRALEFIRHLAYNYPDVYKELSEVELSNDRLRAHLRFNDAVIIADDVSDDAMLEKLSLFLQMRGDELTTDIRYLDLSYSEMVLTGTSNPPDIKAVRSGN